MTFKRLKSVLCLLIFVFFFSSQALAIDLYGFGSYWEPKDVDGSWGGGLGLSIPLITEHLRLDGRVYFFEKGALGTDELKLVPLDLGLQVHILPNKTLDPYLLGGISYVYADADKIDVDSNIGGYIGAGIDWALGNSAFKLFGEILYRFSEIDTDLGEGIDVSGTTGNIGIKFHF